MVFASAKANFFLLKLHLAGEQPFELNVAQLWRANYPARLSRSCWERCRLPMNPHKDGWLWSEIGFTDWRRVVDLRLEEVYANNHRRCRV
jgi:hypothetical protein